MTELRVGASAVEIKINDTGYPHDQEDRFRVTAAVIEKMDTACIISCDERKLYQEFLDPVCRRIESELGIPFNNILITSNHTHFEPRIEPEEIEGAILEATAKAQTALQEAKPCELFFCLGHESTVGQNSRVVISESYFQDDQYILWTPLIRKFAFCRPTGPFDPQLPVLAFMNPVRHADLVLFNHSTHNIGRRTNKEFSPGFYAMAAQELEQEHGGIYLFLQGAAGSTHNLSLSGEEMMWRIKRAVFEAQRKAERQEVKMVTSFKKEFPWRVRYFDENKEQKAVADYCLRMRNDAEETIEHFREKRDKLKDYQGELRKAWLQGILIGKIAFVGVPGELFTQLGLEIKRRSPFRYTYVVNLSNGHIGYMPDRHAYALGGYQTWVGPCQCEEGTGERLVVEAIDLLSEMGNKSG